MSEPDSPPKCLVQSLRLRVGRTRSESGVYELSRDRGRPQRTARRGSCSGASSTWTRASRPSRRSTTALRARRAARGRSRRGHLRGLDRDGLVLEVNDRARSEGFRLRLLRGPALRSSASSNSSGVARRITVRVMAKVYVHTCVRVLDRGTLGRLLRGTRLRAARQAPVRDGVQLYMGLPGDGDTLELTVNMVARSRTTSATATTTSRSRRRSRRAARRPGEDRRGAGEAALRAGRAPGDRPHLLRAGPGRLPHRADRRRRVQRPRRTP